MSNPDRTDALEEQIGQWRNYLSRRQAIHPVDVAELEDHLREQLAALMDAGLDPDEAFLVAVKRIGSLDALSREFAREHSERLWKQLVLVGPEPDGSRARIRVDALVAFGLAVAAAVFIKLPELFGISISEHTGFYARNASLLVLPFVIGYFAWKRRLSTRAIILAGGGLAIAAAFVNLYPFVSDGHTLALASLHVPIALWVAVVGIAYAGNRWRSVSGRMDFIRFSGELFIYYVLIALGGGVLMLLTSMIFWAIGVSVDTVLQSWIIPCGAVGAVVIASWLVEAKQNVVENMAPVLTRLFTPLFAAVLVIFVGTMLWTGHGIDIGRDVLIAFDLLLVLVLALVLYSISARDPDSSPGVFDVLQVVLVVSAIAADAVALWAIAARITEFGLTPNRVAALGMNVILLVNLAWSAVLYIRFMRRRGTFAVLERWQTDYMPVYAAWATLVVIGFPPLFGYV